MNVLELINRPFADVEHVGVAIHRTEHGLHSGLLYRLPDAAPRVVHLAFHHLLRDEPAAEPFRWAQLGLDDDNKIVLSTLLSRIAGSNTRISYGFDAAGACFDPTTGDLLPAPAGKGLTCATFMVAALRTYGHQLLDSATWPDREEDRAWEWIILDVLARYATAEHIEALKRDVGARRFRPDEVVGAATLDYEQWPVDYQSARALADQILEDLG